MSSTPEGPAPGRAGEHGTPQPTRPVGGLTRRGLLAVAGGTAGGLALTGAGYAAEII